ncbi:unnamed protein product [Brugia pahangi]|uniref:Transmembrane protein n=1 Tax=Brugia pahangi TaxID=6280 RepID=A0A0N4TF86_BRUPA|nr:unnamed protein product [Brugia pahangi]
MSEDSDVITPLENILQETENPTSKKRKVDVIPAVKALVPEVIFLKSYSCLIQLFYLMQVLFSTDNLSFIVIEFQFVEFVNTLIFISFFHNY